MSSFRTHPKEPAGNTSKPHNSRIPTKTSTEHGQKSKVTQHVSQLAKRTSTNAEVALKITSRTATPVVEPAHKYEPSRRRSLTPAGTTTPAPVSMRTPSLVSGSSASTFDSPRSNTLRRKPSGAIDRYAAQKRSGGEALQVLIPAHSPECLLQHDFDDSVFGISLPSKSGHEVPQSTTAWTYGSLRDISRGYSVPGNGYAPSATSSTNYTDSPFSHVPTPSSASSYSSGVAATACTPRLRQPASIVRDATCSSRAGRVDELMPLTLHPVRESSTSSSTSTVGDVTTNQSRKEPLGSEPAVRGPPGPHNAAPARSPARHKLRKEPFTSASSKRTTQVPPELAHLNVATPMANAPRRPSRDGTSTISDMGQTSAIVQSDLPLRYTTYHKRTSSQDTPTHDSSPSLKSRFGFPSRLSSRNASPRIDSAISPPPTAVRFKRGTTPEVPSNGGQTRDGSRLHRKDSPAVGPAPSPAKSPRFSFFSRKPKLDTKVTEKPKRLSTKGPVAGTGHEGYGRFGIRGRSASSTSSTGSRSLSSDSTINAEIKSIKTGKSKQASHGDVELDDFLRERLTPRVLRGSGSTWSQTGSVSDGLASVQPVSSDSSFDNSRQPCLMPSALGISERQSLECRPRIGRQNTSESSDNEVNARMYSHSPQMSAEGAAETRPTTQAPQPISRDHRFRRPSMNAVERCTTPDMVIRSTLTSHGSHGAEGAWLRSPSPHPEAKSSRRWNFFQRATASSRSKGKDRALDHTQHTAPVAHYVLTDGVEPVDLAEVEHLVQNLDSSQDEPPFASTRHIAHEERRLLNCTPALTARSDEVTRAKPTLPRLTTQPQHTLKSIGLQEAQLIRPRGVTRAASASQTQRSQLTVPRDVLPDHCDLAPVVRRPAPDARLLSPPSHENGPSRLPRLSPIGRIPAVVSRRDKDRKLSDHSFSRPFARSQPRPTVKPPGSVYSQIREMANPNESGPQPIWNQNGHGPSVVSSSDVTSQAITYTSAVATEGTWAEGQSRGFITFPDRKDSQQSYVSSSSGNLSHPSWMSALIAQPPKQEDVWNEYDDLMDGVVPVKTPTTGSSLGRPFQYASMLHNAQETSCMFPPPASQPPKIELPAPPRLTSPATILTVPQQVSRFLQPSLSPMTPDTISAWVTGYGDRSTITTVDRSSFIDMQRTSAYWQDSVNPESPRYSSPSLRHSTASRHSRFASLPDVPLDVVAVEACTSYYNDAHFADIPERSSRERKQLDNMRYGAFMTSKWLAFGRILFSPANNELRFASEARVLVIDGLSNDWSYYIAQSYRSAEVYSMTMGAKVSSELGWDDSETSMPGNYRSIRVASMSAAFPFPRGFFNAAVIRFPTATTEHAYLNCISECKRVLRPGGYLEVAVLDLDLMNMGSQARKAVKGLKTRMQIRDPSVYLGNLSDLLVRMIGRQGFDGIQRCVVGVPAAGREPSSDLSGSGSDSSGRQLLRRSGSNGLRQSGFMDLLDDTRVDSHEFGTKSDESITKMAAKVGRWWYSSCYEQALLPTDQSIWNERGLVRECQKQCTSFRLLICHAQKPLQTRRRTVSV